MHDNGPGTVDLQLKLQKMFIFIESLCTCIYKNIQKSSH